MASSSPMSHRKTSKCSIEANIFSQNISFISFDIYFLLNLNLQLTGTQLKTSNLKFVGGAQTTQTLVCLSIIIKYVHYTQSQFHINLLPKRESVNLVCKYLAKTSQPHSMYSILVSISEPIISCSYMRQSLVSITNFFVVVRKKCIKLQSFLVFLPIFSLQPYLPLLDSGGVKRFEQEPRVIRKLFDQFFFRVLGQLRLLNTNYIICFIKYLIDKKKLILIKLEKKRYVLIL